MLDVARRASYVPELDQYNIKSNEDIEETDKDGDQVKNQGNENRRKSILFPDNYKGSDFLLLTTRWRLVFLIFIVNILVYAQKVNIHFAIVCMVKTKDLSGLHECAFNGTYVECNKTEASTQHAPVTDTSTSNTETVNGVCNGNSRESYHDENRGELDWDKSQIAVLFSLYFVGCFVAHLPAGRIADTVGAKYIIAIFLLISSICTILTPVLARENIYLVYVARVIIGCTGGGHIPATVSMISAWAPPDERALMLPISFSGFLLGVVVTYFTSGLLCKHGFDNGWPSIFYAIGGLSVVMVIVWWFTAFSLPVLHPRISKPELQYIRDALGSTKEAPSAYTPWKKIFTSKPMWASILAHIAFEWCLTTVLTNVPMFQEEILKYDYEVNGFYSAMMYVCFVLGIWLFTKLASVMINRKLTSALTTRNLTTAVSFVGVAVCLACVGHVSCELRYLAVILLALSCAFASLSFPGFASNHGEYAGRFAGTAFGIANGIGLAAAIPASIIPGLITTNGLQEEWQIVFYIAAGISILGAIAFCTMSSATLEEWAVTVPTVEIVIPEVGDIKTELPADIRVSNETIISYM